jgi:NAD(P)-dependent dehydrogenase (short-subunit alcohol dehydrogenase family)
LLASLESESDDEPQQAFDNLVSLAQAFGIRTASQPLAALVATPQIFDVEDRGEALHSSAATALGPCQVMSREYPELTCRIVDLARADVQRGDETSLVQSLLSELDSESDDVVAYRGGKRWVRIWEAVQLGHSTPANRLRRHGVYLITGGFGGIGLVLGEHLAKAYQAKLVLVSRSPLPPRDQWRSRRAEFDEPVQRKIEKVLTWEDWGAEVLTASANVGHEDEMAEVLEAAVERFGKLDGVIHAAGVAGGGLIQLKAPEQPSPVLTPKVQGTRILERLTRPQNLDFFVLCSSVDAVLAPFGQSDYCAANAFLDAFAHESVGKGRGRVISINWDTWAEVGMAVNTAVPEELAAARKETLRHAIRPEEGVRAFERIVNSEFPQVVISTTDWTGRQERARTASLTAEQTDAESSASPTPQAERHARPELENEYVAPTNEIEAALVEYYQDEMGIAPVGVEDNFFALGGHSLIMMRLAARVREGMDVELTLQDFFEHPTVAQIGHVILEKMISEEDAESLEQMLAELEADQSG